MGAMGAFAAVSAASSLGTAFSQSSAITAKGTYDQSIADTNAKIAGLQEKQTLEAGDLSASRTNLKTQQTTGAMRAAQGASGTDVNTGSNVLARQSADFAGKIDELTIRNNAMREAWGFKTQAISDTFQGQFAKMTATSQSEQTLLTGGLQAIEGPLGIYANYKRWSSRYSGGSGTGVPYDMG